MNTHRYIARIVLEADTPLFVGSGDSSLLKDALVQRGFNGLPMIPGTALTGVLRHSILDVLDEKLEEKSKWEQIFGYQERNKGVGSRLRISSAYMMVNENQVAEGLHIAIDEKVKVKYDNLPSRQHVRIDHKGVAEKGKLFDNDVVYKGTLFKFEIELIGDKTDENNWQEIINKIHGPLFRLGQGTRNGYGKLKINSIKSKIFDLTNDADFNDYTDFDASLNNDTYLGDLKINDLDQSENLLNYKLELTPDSDFFIFSEGYGDTDVDNKPLEEEVAFYNNRTIEFDHQTVIPASSIKGALAHRTAFHFNKLKEHWADNLNTKDDKARETQIKLWTGIFNDAVFELFGAEGGAKREEGAHRGKVIIDDLYYSDKELKNNKIFNHVAIDRFTGGAMEGALFSEKVSQLVGVHKIKLEIVIEKSSTSQYVIEAFENALLDITKGLLPLGGMTTKGMGIFTGTLKKNEEAITQHHLKIDSHE